MYGINKQQPAGFTCDPESIPTTSRESATLLSHHVTIATNCPEEILPFRKRGQVRRGCLRNQFLKQGASRKPEHTRFCLAGFIFVKVLKYYTFMRVFVYLTRLGILERQPPSIKRISWQDRPGTRDVTASCWITRHTARAAQVHTDKRLQGYTQRSGFVLITACCTESRPSWSGWGQSHLLFKINSFEGIVIDTLEAQ